MHILGPFYHAWYELKHTQLLFISLLQGMSHSWVKPDLHMFGWICMISGLQRSCCSLQSESLIFIVPISLHGAPLMCRKNAVFFFSSHCGHYVFWAAQCLSGSSFYEQCQGKWSCHWEILWLFLSFFTACFELWPFRTTGKSEVCWMST